jgi:hypothetical protein
MATGALTAGTARFNDRCHWFDRQGTGGLRYWSAVGAAGFAAGATGLTAGVLGATDFGAGVTCFSCRCTSVLPALALACDWF